MGVEVRKTTRDATKRRYVTSRDEFYLIWFDFPNAKIPKINYKTHITNLWENRGRN